MNDWSRCPSCGTRVKPQDPTCRNCGAALSAAITQADDEPAPAANLLETDKLAAELQRTLGPEIELLRKLGEGGMGSVYLARDPALRRLIAIKVLPPAQTKDTLARARFRREAEAAAAVSHAHVVGIYKVGTLRRSNTPYLMMEYVDGQTLGDVLASGTALPEARAKRIVGEVASALAAAHARGLVHRDIKPENIIIDRESERTVVLDFGVSAVLDPQAFAGSEKLTQQGVSVGTPIYMSPEQAAAKAVTDRSDIYNLGAVAFELVARRPPFICDAPEAYLAAHLTERPPNVRELRPDLDPQFAELINRSLAKRPDRRPSAEEIARALLPSARLLVQWPPPGLDRLHGLGWRLLLTLGTTAALAIIFFGSLVFAPTSRAGTVTTGTLWFAALGASALATALAAIVAVALAGRLALLLRWGRASRYPWPVLLDVAIDPRRDTALLLNARGPFALVGEKVLGWLLRLRRIRAAALALTVAAASIGPVGWTLGWFAQSSTVEGRLLADSEIKLLLLPPLLAALLAVLVALPEMIVRRRAHAGGALVPWRRRRPLIREEQVRGWLEPTGRQPAPEGDPRRQWTVALLPAVFAVVIGIALLAALAATLWTTLTAARWTRAAQTAATAFVVEASAWRPVSSAARRIAISARLPGRRRTLTQQARDDWHAADHALGARMRNDSATAQWLVTPRASWRVAIAAGPPASVRAALRNDSVRRWLATWRSVARTRPAPLSWAAEDSAESGPQYFTTEGTAALARLNEAAGMVAFAEGNRPTAVTRARENLAVGGVLLADPANGHLAGDVLREARAVLFDIGILTGNSDLLVESEELAAVLPPSDLAAQHWLGAAFLMADPLDSAALSMVADSGLPHHMRWSLLRAIADGYCGNAREVLLGVDPRRRDLLTAAGAAAADVPSTEQWVRLIERRLDEWIEAPRGKIVSSRVRRRGAARLVAWLGMRGLGNRVAFCGVAHASPAW